MSFSYRISPTSVHRIIIETCEALRVVLLATEMPQPTDEMWGKISKDFKLLWQFPNCIGAIDGKHINIQAPQNSGSLFYNYKNYFSIVLLAIADAKYKFVAVDVGGYGKSSDGGIFSHSTLGRSLENSTMNIPGPKPLPSLSTGEAATEPLPHVLVGDEAFPLKKYLMRPYPATTSRSNESERIYNYRLSRARRVVENTFGMVVQRFRVLYGKLQMNPDNAAKVVFATCLLHNFLIGERLPEEITDDSASCNQPSLCNLDRIGTRGAFESLAIRDKFKEYFQGDGQVSWQLDVVRRGAILNPE